MQRQKEAVALATAQNRILQQQCKFFQFQIKIVFRPKFHFSAEILVFTNLDQNSWFNQKYFCNRYFINIF